MKTEIREVAIQGIVSPAGWDENGLVQAVCIASDDGTYYYPQVEKNEVDLLPFLKKNVRVRGVVSGRGSTRSIQVFKVEEIQEDYSVL